MCGGRAGRPRQGVGIDAPADTRAGLLGDPLDEAGIGNRLDEDGRDLLRPDLADQPRHVLRRGFRLGRDAARGDEADAVGRAEIGEGVVRGDDAALFGRHARERGADLGLQRVEFGEIGLRVGAVACRSLRIDGDQRVPDVDGVNLRVEHILPGMRIDLSMGMPVAMTMTMAVPARRLQRGDPFCGHDDRCLGAGSLHKPIDPAFEFEAIGDNERRLGEHLSVIGRGCVDMRIAIRPHQSRQRDAVLADSADEIAQN